MLLSALWSYLLLIFSPFSSTNSSVHFSGSTNEVPPFSALIVFKLSTGIPAGYSDVYFRYIRMNRNFQIWNLSRSSPSSRHAQQEHYFFEKLGTLQRALFSIIYSVHSFNREKFLRKSMQCAISSECNAAMAGKRGEREKKDGTDPPPLLFCLSP